MQTGLENISEERIETLPPADSIEQQEGLANALGREINGEQSLLCGSLVRHVTAAENCGNRGLGLRRRIDKAAIIRNRLQGRGQDYIGFHFARAKIVERTHPLQFRALNGWLLRRGAHLFHPAKAAQMQSSNLEIARAMQD